MKQKQASMRLWLCSLSLIFLFNPNINIIDVLPDFVGYLLLSMGLSRMGELNESVGAAVRGFRRMILVDLCKLPALVWVFGMSIPSERNSSLLLWAFVFAVLELLFALPAYLKLYEGMTALGYFYPNSSLLCTGEGRRNPTDRMKRLTVVFLFAKSVLSVLPEFADLGNASYDETSGLVNLYRYIGVMRFLAFVPALCIGLLWLARMLSYWKAIRKDGTLCEGLLRDYREKILPRHGMFVRRDMWSAFVFLLLALGATADVRLDGWNILPDTLGAILFIFVFVFLSRRNETPRRAWMPAWVVYTALTVAEIGGELFFHQNFSYHALIRSPEAMNAFLFLIGATVLKNIALLWLLFCLVRSLGRTVELHTGTIEGQEHQSDREDALARELRHELKVGLWVAYGVSVLYGVIDVLYPILSVNLGFMGLVHLLAVGVTVVVFAMKVSAIRMAVDTRYRLS